MTSLVSTETPVKTDSAEAIKAAEVAEATRRPYVELPSRDWGLAIFFLLGMSMIGLRFPLGYLLVPGLMIWSWRKSRIDFIIQTTILCGSYALVGEHSFPVKMEDVALAISILGIFIYRKPSLVSKIVVAWALYAFVLLFLAMFSDETMLIQIRIIRPWLAFIFFIIPLMCFAGQKFDIKLFFKKLVPYCLTLCAFYILDGFVISGHIFIPHSYIFLANDTSYEPSFWAPAIEAFGTFPRKYPPGLFLMALIVMPLSRYYRFRWYQWLLVIGALLAAKTFTVIVALLFGYMVFQPNIGKKLGYAIFGLVLLTVGYAVDSTLPINPDNDNSTLRIKSSIDQIFALDEAQNDEDLAEAGSGRIGQALPKFELMYHYGKEWTGIGFLHPELTKMTKYIIINEYYTDIERNQEVATGIEVLPLQVFLTVGYIGLIIHFAFYIYLYVVIRRLRYSIYFLAVEVVNFIFGLGGFAGWTQPMGLYLMALAMAAVLLANRETVWPQYKKLRENE